MKVVNIEKIGLSASEAKLQADRLEAPRQLLFCQCPCCNETNIVAVFKQDIIDYNDGKLAQDAFDYLSAPEREMLISGICPKCWDKMFSYE